MNLGKTDYDRVHMETETRYSFGIDEFTPPSKRTIQQKFRIQSMKAVNKLVELNIMMGQAGNLFLEKFAQPISGNPGTMNGAAFALVFCCFDFKSNRFVMKKSEEVYTWKELTELINNPKGGLDEFIKEYGITVNDLIRYLVFATDFMEKN
jgi:hypothetical protein